MATTTQPGSSSLTQPDYWWYRARTDLLKVALESFMGDPVRTLDVGSADGPSVGWMRGSSRRVNLDLNPGGLTPGEGVCGSAMALPFADEVFDVVAAFDVVEHCEQESVAMDELARVLAPGGRMLLSVPAYQWAWTDHDIRAGHFRRYTRRRLVTLVEGAGLSVERATYAFSAVFPFFVAERVLRRLKRRAGRPPDPALAPVTPRVDWLLMALSRLDHRILRDRDLPFGSSVFLAALKPELRNSG
ncbi:MAG TPA: class I SAM-dependent methyltransferase [Nocardioidaceae bacterium]|nr:class I SAM-dependent methyltransferase [Nocardioidaceae bacterium]